MLVILATQEAEIRRITVQSQPGQIAHEILSRIYLTQKRAGGVAQGVGSQFKPWYCKKKKKKNSMNVTFEKVTRIIVFNKAIIIIQKLIYSGPHL
jgi:hypothetical protein